MALSSKLATSVYSPPPSEKGWRPQDVFKGRELRFYSFGRRALAAALEVAGVKKGDKVLMPDFICRDLLSSLAAVGAKPEYYPVNAALEPASDPGRWPSAAAVVAVDYFGFPQDLAPFRAYAERTGAKLIEDAAHGLFSKDEDGKLLGTRADLGILSIRKTLALPNGAALVAPKGADLPPQQPFDAPDEPRYLARQACRVAARLAGASLSYRGLQGLRAARAAISGRRIPAPDPAAERELPEPASACGQLAVPVRVGDPESETKRRRALFTGLLEETRGLVEPVFKSLPAGAVPYGFPFRGGGAAADKRLARLGFEPLRWPDLPDALVASAPAHQKDVRLVHFLW